jgi:ribosomal protein S18 acetylase RimI-like enzyme
MLVRALGEADVAEFWALRLRGFREEPTSFGSSYDELRDRPLADAARELTSRPGDFVLGAFLPALVGVVGLRREPRRKRGHRATLWGMYVGREARGQGVGRALLQELVRRARGTNGLEQILLTVMSHNRVAIALYRELGFQVYGHAPDAMRLDGKAYGEDLMRLDLLTGRAG